MSHEQWRAWPGTLDQGPSKKKKEKKRKESTVFFIRQEKTSTILPCTRPLILSYSFEQDQVFFQILATLCPIC
jgi:hypothetical protein